MPNLSVWQMKVVRFLSRSNVMPKKLLQQCYNIAHTSLNLRIVNLNLGFLLLLLFWIQKYRVFFFIMIMS